MIRYSKPNISFAALLMQSTAHHILRSSSWKEPHMLGCPSRVALRKGFLLHLIIGTEQHGSESGGESGGESGVAVAATAAAARSTEIQVSTKTRRNRRITAPPASGPQPQEPRSSKRSLRGLLMLSVASVPYGDCSGLFRCERSLRGLLGGAATSSPGPQPPELSRSSTKTRERSRRRSCRW